MSQGAEVDFDDDWFDPAPPKVISSGDAITLPFGLGFETQ